MLLLQEENRARPGRDQFMGEKRNLPSTSPGKGHHGADGRLEPKHHRFHRAGEQGDLRVQYLMGQLYRVVHC